MKKLLLSGAALLALAVSQKASAQAWSQNFNANTLPAGWSTLNVDGHTPTSNYGPNFQSKLTAAGWAPITRAAGDSMMITTSWFTTPAQADRWLISQSFAVSANMVLGWEDFAPLQSTTGHDYIDSMQIWISPTAGTTTAAFTTMIYNQRGNASGMLKHGINLSSYAGQTIRVAFRDNSFDEVYLAMDNASAAVLPTADAAISNLTPVAAGPLSYGAVAGTVTLGATVTNNGAANLTSFVVKYQQGTGAVVSQTISGVNLSPYATYSFNFNTPYTIPSLGVLPFHVWVEAAGDVNHTNDTLTTTLTGVPFMPKKRIMVEEGTGTWCGYCVRGMVYMDSLWKTHPNDVSLVAVHNTNGTPADPMTVQAYDAKITSTPGFTGFPSVVIDRREVLDPTDLIDVWTAEHNYFGYAEVTMGTPVITGTTVTVPVTVKPAIDLSGDYRLAFVITEDRVHGTSAGYAQHNYYSGGSLGALANSEYDFTALASVIPATTMFYDFVGRAITPSPAGAPGSLPATMTAGTTYTYNVTSLIQAGWDTTKLRGVVMMLRNSDGQVLNSDRKDLPNYSIITTPTSVTNVSAGINKFTIFPNPAAANASARIELAQASTVSIDVVDISGRIVVSVPVAQMTAGEHIVALPVANLASGVYNVKISTATGSATERLSIVK